LRMQVDGYLSMFGGRLLQNFFEVRKFTSKRHIVFIKMERCALL